MAAESPAQTERYKEEKELQKLLNASEALCLWADFHSITIYFSCFQFLKLKPKREIPASRDRIQALVSHAFILLSLLTTKCNKTDKKLQFTRKKSRKLQFFTLLGSVV
ncbi:hypothetical protein [uncultured Lactobacillus sp.]|uniref:hypothetical protein n=1 Tax=uncultured Lactobacillus sp. TaxID=153152 RepID=UPI0025E403CB|nr:hypothetical protein [uncultured Lactobacillus sp.]